MSIDQFKPNDWQRDDVLENEAAVDFTNANKVLDIDLSVTCNPFQKKMKKSKKNWGLKAKSNVYESL